MTGIFVRYAVTMVVTLVAVLVLGYFAVIFLRSFTWQAEDPLYRLLSWVRDYILLVLILIVAAVWAVVSAVFLARPLRYLDEIISAAGALASPGEDMIELPKALHSVQDEMNRIRERTLLAAAAAREAEQRKNDLIVYLAHDLKTPLTSVIGYLTLLKDEPDISPETRARYTGIALGKALRLEELVSEFFEITRFNLTSMALETERVNLSRMLEQIASEFLPAMDEKALRWKLEIEPDMMLPCDPDKLARVFDNLIRNAVSYSDPGRELALSARTEDGWTEITLRNHGRTIPPDKLEHLFDPFFRLDSSRSSASGGAGLGLAIAREIVEKHGGTIAAESADESIRFIVRLPLIRQKNASISEE